MRYDDTTLFDVEADEAADLTEQFWGASRGWMSPDQGGHDHGSVRSSPRDLTGSIQVIRDGLAAFRPQRGDTTDRINRVGRTRQHGAVRAATLAELGHGDPSRLERREATLGELASVDVLDDDPFEQDWFVDDLPPTSRHEVVPTPEALPLADRLGVGAVDPLLLRLGVAVLIAVLMVPLALALRPRDAAGALQTSGAATAIAAASSAAPSAAATESAENAPAAPAAPATVAPVEGSNPEPASAVADQAATSAESVAEPLADAAPDAVADATSAPDTAPAGAAAAVDDVGDVQQDQPAAGTSDAATADAVAERLMPECPQTYAAGAGDSWYRIAAAADVTPSALMRENRATTDTPIFPGDEICLPAGATMPEPPPTTAPPTTAPPTTAPATTAAPTTTAAPATTAPPAPASTAEVQALIREIWPDELEEKALEIAFRESRYVATAYNGWCCYGVFQLYWTVHRSWLDDYGIYSSNDLFDARKNITAAYALYQGSGGWGPWGG